MAKKVIKEEVKPAKVAKVKKEVAADNDLGQPVGSLYLMDKETGNMKQVGSVTDIHMKAIKKLIKG